MNVSPAARRKARHFAMQAIYQWQMTSAQVSVIEAEFFTDNDMSKADTDYFREVLRQVVSRCGELDAEYRPYLMQREADELDPITLALLRLATFELMSRIDVPYKVVINEAVSLAKKFGATDAHKFVNGVLDKVAVQHRQAEVNADRQG